MFRQKKAKAVPAIVWATGKENFDRLQEIIKCQEYVLRVEMVVLLSKGVVDKDNFRKVKVDFSLEDMDLTELRGKATYSGEGVYS